MLGEFMPINAPVICPGRIKKLPDLVVAVGWSKIGALHAVAMTAAHTRDVSLTTDILVPRRQSSAERSAPTPRNRLNPDILERPFTQNFSIADTVERHASGQTQIALTSFTM